MFYKFEEYVFMFVMWLILSPIANILEFISFFGLTIFFGSISWSFFGFLSIIFAIISWVMFYNNCRELSLND